MNIVMQRLIGAMNAHDLDAMLALIHPEYVSRQPAHPGRAFVGSSQVRVNWAAMFAGVPDLQVEVHRSVEDGDTTWCEWSWTGSRVDGRPFEVHGVALFRVRDGLVDAGTLYVEEVEADNAGIEQAVQGLSGRRPDGAADEPS